MAFKDDVLFVRAKLNLSQKQLGDLMNVSLGTISRWENGKVQPTKKALCAFSQLCHDNQIVINEEKNND